MGSKGNLAQKMKVPSTVGPEPYHGDTGPEETHSAEVGQGRPGKVLLSPWPCLCLEPESSRVKPKPPMGSYQAQRLLTTSSKGQPDSGRSQLSTWSRLGLENSPQHTHWKAPECPTTHTQVSTMHIHLGVNNLLSYSGLCPRGIQARAQT